MAKQLYKMPNGKLVSAAGMRKLARAGSNGDNPDKNGCTNAVCEFLGTADATRYLHTEPDVLRSLRTRYSVRSRKSSIKGRTIGAARPELDKLTSKEVQAGKQAPQYFLVFVKGHVLLLDNQGRTACDTDPRKRDKRQIKSIYAVFPKPGYVTQAGLQASLNQLFGF